MQTAPELMDLRQPEPNSYRIQFSFYTQVHQKSKIKYNQSKILRLCKQRITAPIAQGLLCALPNRSLNQLTELRGKEQYNPFVGIEILDFQC